MLRYPVDRQLKLPMLSNKPNVLPIEVPPSDKPNKVKRAVMDDPNFK